MNKYKTLLNRAFSRLAVIALLAFLAGCATAPKQASAGRIHHIGLVWLKAPGNAADREKVIAAAHRFAREIPEVRALSVGQTLPAASPYVDASFDVCLSMEFADRAAMERYNRHPVHQEAAREVFFPLAQKFLFYDFVSE